MRVLMNKGIKCTTADFEVRNDIPICDKVNQKEVVVELNKILTEISIMYFGLHQSQIQEIILNKVIKTILSDFRNMKLSEVLYSYERATVERKITYTVDDYLLPVIAFQTFLKNKHICISEINKEEQEKQKQIELQKKFKQESVSIYKESLKKGSWLGSIWQANAIKDILKVNFDFEFRKKLYDEAGQEALLIPDYNEMDFDEYHKFMGMNQQTIYADKLARISVENKIEI